MNIFEIVWRNLRQPARSRAPDDPAPLAPGFRGMLAHDTSLCVGCSACARVCPSGTIALEALPAGDVEWRYFAGQCAFCGTCVQYCPTGALTHSGALPPVGADPARLRIEHRIGHRSCVRCGAPVIPLPDALLPRLYAGGGSEAAREDQRLCPECRRLAASERLREALGPERPRPSTGRSSGEPPRRNAGARARTTTESEIGSE